MKEDTRMATKRTAEETQAEVNEIEAYFARKEMATAPAWRPDIGESIFGQLVEIRKGIPSDPKLKPYPIFILRTETGTTALHGFHTMLWEGMKDVGAKKGGMYGVTYEGTRIKNTAKDTPEDEREATDTYHFYFVADMNNLHKETETEEFEL